MSRVPRVTGSDLFAALAKAGFAFSALKEAMRFCAFTRYFAIAN